MTHDDAWDEYLLSREGFDDEANASFDSLVFRLFLLRWCLVSRITSYTNLNPSGRRSRTDP